MALSIYPDLITPQYAVADPQLAGYAVDDVMLLRKIKVASARVQAYLRRTFTAVEVETLPEDIKDAVVMLVVRMLVTHPGGAEFRRRRESLGDYAYENEYADPRGRLGLPDAIRELLYPYVVTKAPAVAASEDWDVPPAEST